MSIWNSVKKEKNLMWMAGNITLKFKIRDKNFEFKESKDIFGRLLILSQSGREIDRKQAISTYEFTMTPMSLFTPDGKILPCTEKSKLMQAIDEVSTEEHLTTLEPTSDEQMDPKIAVVDGMNLLQRLTTKMTAVETVKDLGFVFNRILLNLTKDFDEIVCVFDTYKEDSLKK